METTTFPSVCADVAPPPAPLAELPSPACAGSSGAAEPPAAALAPAIPSAGGGRVWDTGGTGGGRGELHVARLDLGSSLCCLLVVLACLANVAAGLADGSLGRCAVPWLCPCSVKNKKFFVKLNLAWYMDGVLRGCLTLVYDIYFTNFTVE